MKLAEKKMMKTEKAPASIVISALKNDEEQIAMLAYSFYQDRGHINGHDVADWVKAEAKLRRGSKK